MIVTVPCHCLALTCFFFFILVNESGSKFKVKHNFAGWGGGVGGKTESLACSHILFSKFDIRATDARTVHLHEETLAYNDGYMYETWPGCLKLPTTSLFVAKLYRVWVLVFLVRTGGALCDRN